MFRFTLHNLMIGEYKDLDFVIHRDRKKIIYRIKYFSLQDIYALLCEIKYLSFPPIMTTENIFKVTQ